MTERQIGSDADVLRWITKYTKMCGYPPSVREVAEEFGVSRGSAHNALAEMVANGVIRRSPGVARAISVTPAGMKLLNKEEMT